MDNRRDLPNVPAGHVGGPRGEFGPPDRPTDPVGVTVTAKYYARDPVWPRLKKWFLGWWNFEPHHKIHRDADVFLGIAARLGMTLTLDERVGNWLV